MCSKCQKRPMSFCLLWVLTFGSIFEFKFFWRVHMTYLFFMTNLFFLTKQILAYRRIQDCPPILAIFKLPTILIVRSPYLYARWLCLHFFLLKYSYMNCGKLKVLIIIGRFLKVYAIFCSMHLVQQRPWCKR